MNMFIWFIITNVTISRDVTTTIQLSVMIMNDDNGEISYIDSEQIIQPVSTVIEKKLNKTTNKYTLFCFDSEQMWLLTILYLLRSSTQ